MAVTIGGSLVLTGGVTLPTPVNIGGTLVLNGGVNIPTRAVTRKRVVLVDNQGVPASNGRLDGATVGTVSFAPCKPSTWSFRMSAADPKLDAVIASKYQEAQIWFGSRLLSWGPIVGSRCDGDTWEFTGAGASWYPCRRTVGPAQRQSLLGDGFFSTGLEGWTTAVTGPGSTYTAQDANAYLEVVAHPQLWGKKSLHIHDATSNPPTTERQPFAYKDYLLVPGAFPREVRLRARYLVTSFTEANKNQSGLILKRFPMVWTSAYDDPIEMVVGKRIDENHPTGVIVDHECSITVPPATAAYIRAQIEAPKGDTYVTDVWFEYDEGLEFSGEDQADIFFKTCDHLTGNTSSPYTFATIHPNYPWETSGYDKSNVRISVDATATGRTRSRQYMFAETRRGEQVLGDFQDFDDGLEWGERFTTTTRTIFTQYPKLGRYRRDCTLRYTPSGGNILGFSYSFEGEQGANSITVLPPSGGWRTGASMEASAFANSTTIEDVLQAPVDASRDSLDRLAAKRLDQSVNPVALTVVVAADPLWTDRGLEVGDRVHVVLKPSGVAVQSSTWWIRALSVDEENRLRLDMIPWAGELV